MALPAGTIADQGPRTGPNRGMITHSYVVGRGGNGNAGLYGGIGPTAYVNNLYAPAEQVLQNRTAAQRASLLELARQFVNGLNESAAQLAPYTAAGNQQTANAQALADSLRAANPNAVTQADLAAVNAPQAQQQQVGNQNQAVFGGNAALLQYAGGKVPSDVFASDAAGRASYLASLPALAQAITTQGLGRLNATADQNALQLATDKANALQKARVDLANYVLGNQKLRAQQAAANAKATVPNASLSRALGYLVDSSGNPVVRGGKLAVLPGYTMNTSGQVVKMQKPSGSRGKGGVKSHPVSSSLSKQTGYWTDSYGNIIIGSDGKPIAWKNAVKAPARPSVKQTAAWNGILQAGYDNRPAGTTYYGYLVEAVDSKVPLGAAIAYANKKWPITSRTNNAGKPISDADISGIAGAIASSGATAGAGVVQRGYTQMTQSGAPQQYAISKLGQYGWNNAAQAQALDQLWTRESGWNPNAVNKSSGAYGIPQSLGHGRPFALGDYKAQIDWGLNYIRARYGSPVAAWAHELANGWY